MGLPAQRLLGCRRLARALWLPVVCCCDVLAAAVAVVAQAHHHAQLQGQVSSSRAPRIIRQRRQPGSSTWSRTQGIWRSACEGAL